MLWYYVGFSSWQLSFSSVWPVSLHVFSRWQSVPGGIRYESCGEQQVRYKNLLFWPLLKQCCGTRETRGGNCGGKMSSDLKAHFGDVDWGMLRTFLVNVYQLPRESSRHGGHLSAAEAAPAALGGSLFPGECVWGNVGKWKSQLCFRDSDMDWQGHTGALIRIKRLQIRIRIPKSQDGFWVERHLKNRLVPPPCCVQCWSCDKPPWGEIMVAVSPCLGNSLWSVFHCEELTFFLSFSTAIGIRCKDGVVFGVEKLVLSKLYEEGSNKRLFNVDRHVGMVSCHLISAEIYHIYPSENQKWVD